MEGLAWFQGEAPLTASHIRSCRSGRVGLDFSSLSGSLQRLEWGSALVLQPLCPAGLEQQLGLLAACSLSSLGTFPAVPICDLCFTMSFSLL